MVLCVLDQAHTKHNVFCYIINAEKDSWNSAELQTFIGDPVMQIHWTEMEKKVVLLTVSPSPEPPSSRKMSIGKALSLKKLTKI